MEEVHADPENTSMTVFAMALFNAFFNITGQPAISLPLEVSSTGLPIGVHFVGGPWPEDALIRLAAQLAVNYPWSQRTVGPELT